MNTTPQNRPRPQLPAEVEGEVPTRTDPPKHVLRWWALAALALAEFLVVLDASIVNIALPSIGADLRLSQDSLAWIITAYVLPFGGLLLFGGRLGDRFGHRRIFLVGTGAFIASSALAGLSFTGELLLTARAVQGASAALLAPASLALVIRLFATARDRSKALGIWGAIAGVGSAAGVLLGGILTATFGWEAVFFVNVPIGILVLVSLPFLVSRDRITNPARIDIAGAVTATGALVALAAGLTSSEQFGFAHPLVLSLLAAATLLSVVFLLIERRVARPLLPFSVFTNRALSAGNIAMLLLGATMVAIFYALSVHLQEVLGFDPLAAGLSQLPLALALIVAAGAAPLLVGRIGRRVTLAVALVILAVGLIWLAAAAPDASFAADVLGPTIVIGLGLGGAYVTTTELAMHRVADGESGLAGGLISTSQQVGGALGLAVLGTLATARTHWLERAGEPATSALAGGFDVIYLGAAVLAAGAAVIALTLRSRRNGSPE